jgi:hypothetical protein
MDGLDQVLPHMAAFVCRDCISQGRRTPVWGSEISNKSFPPWTQQEVEALSEYQSSPAVLPFICSLGHILKPERSGLICTHCAYFHLHWTYPWILNGRWKQELLPDR